MALLAAASPPLAAGPFASTPLPTLTGAAPCGLALWHASSPDMRSNAEPRGRARARVRVRVRVRARARVRVRARARVSSRWSTWAG